MSSIVKRFGAINVAQFVVFIKFAFALLLTDAINFTSHKSRFLLLEGSCSTICSQSFTEEHFS